MLSPSFSPPGSPPQWTRRTSSPALRRIGIVIFAAVFAAWLWIVATQVDSPTAHHETDPAVVESTPPTLSDSASREARGSDGRQKLTIPAADREGLPPLAELASRRRASTNGHGRAGQFGRSYVSQCGKFYRGITQRGFALMSMHGPVYSIEQKLAMTFAPALRELHNRRVLGVNSAPSQSDSKTAGARPSARSIARLTNGKICTDDEWESSPVIVDVGVNDGEDIPTWFEQFGTWHDTCTTYLLFEPQQKYWSQIASEVRRHFLLQPGMPPDERMRKIAQRRGAVYIEGRGSLNAPGSGPAGRDDVEGAPEDIQSLKSGIETVMAHFDDEAATYFGSRSLVADGGPGPQRRVALLRAAVGPNEMHNKTVVLVGEGQSASIVSIDKDATASRRGTSTIRMLSLYYVLNNFTSSRQHITFMKIDCEGADATILKSSEPLFAEQRVDFVMFEINKVVRNFPVNFPTAISMLRRHRYRCFIVGYDRPARAFMLSEVDDSVFAFWRPKLETMVCMPDSILGGVEGADGARTTERLLPNGLVPGAVEVSAGDKYDYFARMMGVGERAMPTVKYWSDMCFGSVFHVPCASCGGERHV